VIEKRLGELAVGDKFWLLSGQPGTVYGFKRERYATPDGEFVNVLAACVAIYYPERGLLWKTVHPSVVVKTK
jgi:hypothetical protein